MADLIELSLEAKVERFLDEVFGGLHRVRKVTHKQNHYEVVPYGTLATHDDDKLTRAVVASHKLGLRVEVDNHGMQGVKLLLHNRTKRSGRCWERHPTLESVLDGVEVSK